jgi:DnaJ-domain-containing protein 1
VASKWQKRWASTKTTNPSISVTQRIVSRSSLPSTSSVIFPSSRQRFQQDHFSDPSFHVNTVLRRLSIATVGITMKRIRSDLLEREKQQKHQDVRSHSTLAQTDDDDEVVDYFAIFDMPRRYDLDMKELKQRYLQLMNKHHPDKLHHKRNSSSDDAPTSSLTANDITNAYQILTESHTRANHLLELIRHPILEDNCQRGNEPSSSSALVGMEFLMQVMEWRERIDTLAMCSKHTADGIPCSCGSDDKDYELKKLFQETQSLQHECEDELAALWNKGEDDLDEEKLQRIRTLTAQLQYWHRLETTLQEEMEL